MSDCEAASVTRIWSNGKLVWTRLTGATDTALANSEGSDLWDSMTFYSGAATQLPDPTYEAAVGAGNAPAYRGRSTLMIQGLDLGSSGQLPNLTFELSRLSVVGMAGSGAGPVINAAAGSFIGSAASTGTVFRVPISTSGTEFASNSTIQVYDIDVIAGTATVAGTYLAAMNRSQGVGNSDTPALFGTVSSTGYLNRGLTGTFTTLSLGEVMGSSGSVRYAIGGGDMLVTSIGSGTSNRIYRHSVSGGSPAATSAAMVSAVSSMVIMDGTVYAVGRNDQVFVLDLATLTLQSTINGPNNSGTLNQLTNLDGELGLWEERAGAFHLYVLRDGAWVALGNVSNTLFGFTTRSVALVGSVVIGAQGVITTSPQTYSTWYARLTINSTTESVRDVVDAICARAGMPAGSWDASALTGITKPVRSLALQTGPSRGTLEQLSTAFFFQACLRDKLYFRPRGVAPAVTIPWADLAAKNEAPDEQSFPLTVGNDLELPPQVAVSYINVNDDGQAGTEYSDRMTGGQAAVQTVRLGVGMTPAEAKGIADAVVIDTAAALVSGAISLPMTYAKLDPSDVVQIIDRDGRAFQVRLTRKRDALGVLGYEVIGDDSTATASQQATDTTQTPANDVGKASNTVFLALDIPILRDDDNAAGYYVAAKGAGTTWPGGQVLSSSNNTDFSTVATVTESAIFGTCTTTLGGFTDIGFDEQNALTVNVGNGQLSSSTRAAMLADQAVNVLLVGDEVIRFRTATLVSAGVYTVSGLLRGQRGTEWAMGTHVAAERCALLRMRGLRRVAQQASETGQARYLRSGTLGSTVLPATTNFTNSNRGLKPLAPVDIRAAAQPSQDVLITWRRRSRLSTVFLPSTGVRLGEASEAYVVRVYTLGPTTLRRTISATATQATYTRAQQLADGVGLGTALRIDVTQVSAVVGEGYIGSTSAAAGAASSIPQVYQITLGGTFAAGVLLRAVLGSLTIDYTTVSGDTNLAGAAASFAAAIDATAAYAATSSGALITVTGAAGVAYSAAVSTPGGDNAVTAVQIQRASDAAAGTSFLAYLPITNPVTGNAATIPAGVTFSAQVIFPADTVACSVTYTTTSSVPAAYVHAAMRDLANADTAWTGPGFQYGQNYLESTPVGVVVGPAGAANIALSLSASPPYALSASVQSPGSAAIPSALPQISSFIFGGTAAAGYTYRVTLAGTNFDYTASGGDTMTAVASALAALIDAAAAYTSYSASSPGGPSVVVTSAATGFAAAFTYFGSVIASTMTLSGAITQFAT